MRYAAKFERPKTTNPEAAMMAIMIIRRVTNMTNPVTCLSEQDRAIRVFSSDHLPPGGWSRESYLAARLTTGRLFLFGARAKVGVPQVAARPMAKGSGVYSHIGVTCSETKGEQFDCSDPQD